MRRVEHTLECSASEGRGPLGVRHTLHAEATGEVLREVQALHCHGDFAARAGLEENGGREREEEEEEAKKEEEGEALEVKVADTVFCL